MALEHVLLPGGPKPAGGGKGRTYLGGIAGVVWAGDAIDLGTQDGACLNEGRVRWVGGVESDGAGKALGRAPEGRACRGGRVLWEGEGQLRARGRCSARQ